MKISLAEFVKKKRAEMRLSTTDVERRSGGRISDSYISRIENGHIHNVSPNKLDALAEGLGVPVDELYRVARGLDPEGSKEKLEILAESFNGKSLTESDWQEIEAVVKVLVEQKKAFREAVKGKK